MWGRRLWYLAVAAGCFVFYICYQEWFSWLLLLGVLGLPWLSLLLSLPGMVTFRVRTSAEGHVMLGTDVPLRLMGSSGYPVPPFRGQTQVDRALTGESWTFRYAVKLPTEVCGALTITAQKVFVYDYLGLFRFPVRKLERQKILVRPYPVALPTPPDLERYLAKAWKPKPGGGYAENHELRLYRPGDSLNQVHWKLTAKTGKPIIREAMEPQRGRILLTIDVCGTGEELNRKFGRLLWLGKYLLSRELSFEIHGLTGAGLLCHGVSNEQELQKAMDMLLGAAPVTEGTLRDQQIAAFWRFHVGGEPDEP